MAIAMRGVAVLALALLLAAAVVGAKKVGMEVEVKGCTILSDAKYKEDDMPTVWDEGGVKIELDIEVRKDAPSDVYVEAEDDKKLLLLETGARASSGRVFRRRRGILDEIKNAQNLRKGMRKVEYKEPSLDTMLKKHGYERKDQVKKVGKTTKEDFVVTALWQFEADVFVDSIKEGVELLNTELAKLKLRVERAGKLGTYFVVDKDAAPNDQTPPLKAYKWSLTNKKNDKFTMLIPEACFAAADIEAELEGYTQFNVDYTLDEYLAKLQLIKKDGYKLLDAGLKDSKKEIKNRAGQQVELYTQVKANLDRFTTWLGLKTDWTPGQKLQLYFIANALDNKIGNSGAFKNSFYLMPKTLFPKLSSKTLTATLATLKRLDKTTDFSKLDDLVDDPRYCKQQKSAYNKLKDLAERGGRMHKDRRIIIGEWRDPVGWFKLTMSSFQFKVEHDYSKVEAIIF